MREYVVGYWVNGSARNINSILAENAEAAFQRAVNALPDLRHDPVATRIKVTSGEVTLIDRPATAKQPAS
jgi:hypothetical protein